MDDSAAYERNERDGIATGEVTVHVETVPAPGGERERGIV
jgi:hypothetical protein